jgi:hypothetical protein
MSDKKRKVTGLPPGVEPSLYDQEAMEEEEVDTSDQIEHTNGHTPEQVDYLETADEAELRSAIFNVSDVVEVVIAVPEWKVKDKDGKLKVVKVLIRSLNARERAQYLNAASNNVTGTIDLVKAYPDLVILTARHPVTKKLLFKPQDRDALNQKMGRAIERIAMKAGEISGLSQEALEDMKKN